MMSDSRPTAEPAPVGIPEPVLEEIERSLRQREQRREEIHDRARKLRRHAQTTMGRLHESRDETVAIAEIRRDCLAFSDELRGELRSDAGLAQDAFQEAVEAILLDAVVRGVPLPAPGELRVPPETYLLAVGDLVGELRRLALRALTEGRLDPAEQLVRGMEQLYHALMRFDTPRSVVPLKPKQDTARSLLERTRGDLALARVLARAHLPPPAGGRSDP
jgi:translin